MTELSNNADSFPPDGAGHYASWDRNDVTRQSVCDILLDAARKWPQNVAVEFAGRGITYSELDKVSSQFADGLLKLGISEGARVGLYLPNCPQYPIAFFGILKAGACVVNLSPLDAARVIEHKIEDSGAEVVVTLDFAELPGNVRRVATKTRVVRIICGNPGDFGGASESTEGPADMSADSWSGEVTFEELLKLGAHSGVKHAPRWSAAQLAVIQYTGGTTGLPKGAMLSHANLSAASTQYLEFYCGTPPLLREGVERLLVVLPLFHIFALSAVMLVGMRIGACLVLKPRFDAVEAIDALSTGKVTVFCGVPTMYVALVSQPALARAHLEHVKFFGSGGAPLSTGVSASFSRIAGHRIHEGWGMTETSPAGTFTPVGGLSKPGSCGIPMPGVEIKLLPLDGSGRSVSVGDQGEICVKGPNLMQGYWNQASATAEAMTSEGFFRTGDVGMFDADGYMYLVDRTKDMLLCGGFNVYPRVIEDAISEHPLVAEVCVIGIPDPYRGQSPKAFIVTRGPGADLKLEELQDFLRDRLGKHEMISALEVRESLPKTPIGKLSKRDLVEQERLADQNLPSP